MHEIYDKESVYLLSLGGLVKYIAMKLDPMDRKVLGI